MAVVTDWNVRLPPVAAILAAIERERAVSALAVEHVPTFEELAKNHRIQQAVVQRLHWPRDRAHRPWRVGIAMIGGSSAPWEGVGNVVRCWSGSSFCAVWRKLPLPDHPDMKQWKMQLVTIEGLARAILRGDVRDAYP